FLILEFIRKKTHSFLTLNKTSYLYPHADERLYLLFYEGIRQQLLVRKGFVCPNNHLNREKELGRSGKSLPCRCPTAVQEFLTILSLLAFDGLFGPGEWSLPPCLSNVTYYILPATK